MRIGRGLDPFPPAEGRRGHRGAQVQHADLDITSVPVPVSRWFERRGPTAAHAEQPRDPLQRLWYWVPADLGESVTAGNQPSDAIGRGLRPTPIASA